MKEVYERVHGVLFFLADFVGENHGVGDVPHRFAVVHRLALDNTVSGVFGKPLLAHQDAFGAFNLFTGFQGLLGFQRFFDRAGVLNRNGGLVGDRL